jgi:hypothetical protein
MLGGFTALRGKQSRTDVSSDRLRKRLQVPTRIAKPHHPPG